MMVIALSVVIGAGVSVGGVELGLGEEFGCVPVGSEGE